MFEVTKVDILKEMSGSLKWAVQESFQPCSRYQKWILVGQLEDVFKTKVTTFNDVSLGLQPRLRTIIRKPDILCQNTTFS